MNLRLVDTAIKSYAESLDEGDMARLAFFRALWGVQNDVANNLESDYEVPSAQDIRAAVKLKTPVFATKAVPVDAKALASCIGRMARESVENGFVTAQAQAGLERVDWEGVIAATDVELAGANPSAYLVALSEALVNDGMDQAVVGLAVAFASLSLRAFLEKPAASVWAAVKEAELVEQCHPQACPVCGSAPALSHVGGRTSSHGRGRQLVCTQCGTAWEYERVRCARCGTQNQLHLHFFNLEGDDSHRIATCDECGGYIRTLFSADDPTEQLKPCSYEVEDVVMARLDAVANDPRFNAAAAASRGE